MNKEDLHHFFMGLSSLEEIKEIRKWFEASPENRETFFRERKMFDAIMLLAETKKQKKQEIRSRPGRTIRFKIPHLAAMLAIVFTLGLVTRSYINQQDNSEITYYETIVPLGAKSQIILTDGTKVWLNAGSRLRYSGFFGMTHRQVELEGEGYFEVARNDHLPFDVRTSHLTIRALGTAFNVKAYPNEETIETILVEGEIEVTHIADQLAGKEKVLLKPKQRLTLMKENDEILFEEKPKEKETSRQMQAPRQLSPNIIAVEATTNYMACTSWKDKRWKIESESLGSLATKLERRYNVTVRFKDQELINYKFNGTLEEEPIEEVLRALALAAPVKFKLNGNEVILSHNGRFKKEHQALYETSK